MYQKVAENKRRTMDDNALLAKRGKVVEFTKAATAPSQYDMQKPYYIALIEFDDGSKITAQVVDTDELKVGMVVEGILRKLYADGDCGLIHYGVKFRPIIR